MRISNGNRAEKIADAPLGTPLNRWAAAWRGDSLYRFLPFLLSALLCVFFAELTARAFWRLSYGISFRNPTRILYAFYPELQNVYANSPSHGDEFYDILLLGGSVLHAEWGQVEQDLREQLAFDGYHNVRIHNLAKPAHTSRDSLLKYTALDKPRFELVIVYHGINEVRANNAPAEIFRKDYGHYSWYEVVNAMASFHGTTAMALPYTLRFIALKIRQSLTKDRFVPTNEPRKDWLHYGRESRSAISFKQNLEAIIDLTKQRGDRVLLMTFATYVPENYSLEAFKEKRLDYGLHHEAIEMWGVREHVIKTVALHNEEVRRLAATREGVLFVDQASLMAGIPRYYNDPCHFTVVGSSKFVEHLLGSVRPGLQRKISVP